MSWCEAQPNVEYVLPFQQRAPANLPGDWNNSQGGLRATEEQQERTLSRMVAAQSDLKAELDVLVPWRSGISRDYRTKIPELLPVASCANSPMMPLGHTVTLSSPPFSPSQ